MRTKLSSVSIDEFLEFLAPILRVWSTALVLILVLALIPLLDAVAQTSMFYHDSSPASAQTKQTTSATTEVFTRRLKDPSLADDSYHMDLLGEMLIVKRMQLPNTVAPVSTTSRSAAQRSMDVFYFADRRGSVTFNKLNGNILNARIHDVDAHRTFVGDMGADGQIEFVEQDINEHICVNYEKGNSANLVNTQNRALANPDLLNEATVTEAQVRSLESRSGASRVLYIDYWGGVVRGTVWNAENMNRDIPYEPYDIDGNSGSFSQQELQRMYVAWAEAAEDYAPFDINVTTDITIFNSASLSRRSRIIATPTDTVAPGAGGIAYVNVFGANSDYYTIGWTFNDSFGSMGMTHSHEAGHQMGLRHDGGSANPDYYSGHDNWGPIMGAPFGKDYVQWSKGDYRGANQTQNDLDIVEAKLSLVADEAGDSVSTAEPISIEGTELVGVITPPGLRADVDIYLLQQSQASTVTIDVRSYAEGLTSGTGPNLSMRVQLRNNSGSLIAQQGPTNNASSNAFRFSQSLAPGLYYLSVRNESPNSDPVTGFNEYGNGGYYRVLVSGGIASSGDDDNDSVENRFDNCPDVPNRDQLNTDGDSQGDACDADDDNDNRDDDVDNCPLVKNNNQANLDGDSLGDVCDPDDDNDRRNDDVDNCPRISNADQANFDGDSRGDVCDSDDDNDGVADTADNCPFSRNANQANLDGDADGDACDNDIDGDGVANGADSHERNPRMCSDNDRDQCDDCSRGSFNVNNDGPDADGDGICDVSDPSDSDKDNIADKEDNCPTEPNTDQADGNNNGIGDVCEDDEVCMPVITGKGGAVIICL